MRCSSSRRDFTDQYSQCREEFYCEHLYKVLSATRTRPSAMQPAASCGIISATCMSMHSLHVRPCHKAPLIRPADGVYGRRPMRPLQSACCVRPHVHSRHRACASSSSHESRAQSSDKTSSAQQCQQESSDCERFGLASHFPAEASPSTSNHWLSRSLRLAGMVAVSVIAGGSMARVAHAESRCPRFPAVLSVAQLIWVPVSFLCLSQIYWKRRINFGAALRSAGLSLPLRTTLQSNHRVLHPRNLTCRLTNLWCAWFCFPQFQAFQL